MKTQTLYKRLSLPLLLTVISATGIGLSSPARPASLLGSQSTAIDANPEAILIARNQCPNGMSPNFPPPCWKPPTERYRKNSIYQREQQQREQQQREQQQRELQQQQPTAEPSPQN